LDAVIVKVGGSLALQAEKLRSLCIKLTGLSHDHKLVVVPGGGEFADVARNLDSRFHLSPQVAHRMAILGMDQYGLLLADLLPSSSLVEELGSIQEVLDSDRLPVFLPAAYLSFDRTLENSWDVTSDSIAVYVAAQLNVPKVILVTDVDGVFSRDPKKFSDAKLISQLCARDLLEMHERTSVDKFLPKLLLQVQIDCVVVNGLHPHRLETILNGKDTVCTLIAGKPKKS
jgi:hypothetical protein